MGESNLLKAMREATADDLLAVQKEIAEREAEVAALRVIEKALRARLGVDAPQKPGPKPKAPADQKPDGGGGELALQRRRAAATLLIQEGRMGALEVARRLSIPQGSISAVLSHPWFQKTPDGFLVSPEGRRECG